MKRKFWAILILGFVAAGGLYLLQISRLNRHLNTYHAHLTQMTNYILGHDYEEARKSVIQFKGDWSDLRRSSKWSFPFSNKTMFSQEHRDIQGLWNALEVFSHDDAMYYLDKIRFETVEWCQRHQRPYAYGPIWDFECTLRNVYEIATDEMLGLVDWNVFEWMVSDLQYLWKKVENIRPELLECKGNDIEGSRKQLNEKLFAFTRAVETSDGQNFSQSAQEMYQTYLDFVKLLAENDGN